MTAPHASKSAQIRARLNHPIIDSDGHTIENPNVLAEYIKSESGPKTAERFLALRAAYSNLQAGGRSADGSPVVPGESLAEARERGITRGPWWGIPAANTLDRATAMLPKLLYERMDELGLDYSVLYTTLGFTLIEIEDEELRRASCRALNRMRADMTAGFGDRLTAAAVIPMHTPQEAIAELEFAVGELGMKSAMMASFVKRPIPSIARKYPAAAQSAYTLDVYGIDSDYDYDPFWAKCQELGIAPTFHSLGYTWGSRQSYSNYVYNHVGSFAASAEAICKGLLLGGVPLRFPKLRFGFLEGGVAWAVICYCDLISHWHKRNGKAMRESLDPALVDQNLLASLVAHYARRQTDGDLRMLRGLGAVPAGTISSDIPLDEFGKSGIQSAEDLRKIFTEKFYFGCEGDDPLNAMAFNARGIPFDARLRPLYGSDIGHWDVPDMAKIAEETYELVEHGIINEEALRAFVFDNAVTFWTANNPDFFKNTIVERAVGRRRAELLGSN
ncbi:MAG TPA: amidohydrolase family protein [Candidatus Binataceae bacterium]|nr:amidohydrolase family protein [Candidatus Binataceae bacterium]